MKKQTKPIRWTDLSREEKEVVRSIDSAQKWFSYGEVGSGQLQRFKHCRYAKGLLLGDPVPHHITQEIKNKDAKQSYVAKHASKEKAGWSHQK